MGDVMIVTITEWNLNHQQFVVYDQGLLMQVLGKTRPKNLHASPCWSMFIDERGWNGDRVRIHLRDDGETCL
jgi:hypothetical protein